MVIAYEMHTERALRPWGEKACEGFEGAGVRDSDAACPAGIPPNTLKPAGGILAKLVHLVQPND